MHTRRSIIPLILAFGVFSSCQPAPASLSEKDVSDIKASVDRWVSDFLSNKRDDLGSIITDDIVLMPPNAAPISGRDAAMAYMKGYPPITKFTATKDEVVGQGDLAYVRGSYSIDVTLPDKSTSHDQGTFLETHRKQSDGTWRYSRLMWHSAEPVPAPAQASAKKR